MVSLPVPNAIVFAPFPTTTRSLPLPSVIVLAPFAGRDRVVTRPAADRVVAHQGGDRIARPSAGQRVVAGVAQQRGPLGQRAGIDREAARRPRGIERDRARAAQLETDPGKIVGTRCVELQDKARCARETEAVTRDQSRRRGVNRCGLSRPDDDGVDAGAEKTPWPKFDTVRVPVRSTTVSLCVLLPSPGSAP